MTPTTESKSAPASPRKSSSTSPSQPPPRRTIGDALVHLLHNKPYVFLIFFGIFIILPPGLFIFERRFIADRIPQLVEGHAQADYSQKLYITIKDIDIDSGTANIGVQFTTLNPALKNKPLHATLTNGEFITDEASQTSQQIIQTSQHRVSFTLNPLHNTPIHHNDLPAESVFEQDDLQIRVEGQADLYPFDSYHLYVQSTLQTNDQPITAYRTYFWLDDPQLIYYANPVNMLDNAQGTSTYRPNTVQVNMQRPFYYILYIISILLLMFSIVFWTLWRLYRKGSTKGESPFEVLGLNLAIILAIPDVRGLLVPEELPYVPVIDTSLATIIMLSLYCVVIYIIKRNILPTTKKEANPVRYEESESGDTTAPPNT